MDDDSGCWWDGDGWFYMNGFAGNCRTDREYCRKDNDVGYRIGDVTCYTNADNGRCRNKDTGSCKNCL